MVMFPHIRMKSLRDTNKMTNLRGSSDVIHVAKEVHHVRTDTTRRTLGSNRTPSAATQAAAVPLPWTKAARQPQGTDRHPVRAQDRHSVGRSAPGTGVWEWHDLLAALARLASGRSLAGSA